MLKNQYFCEELDKKIDAEKGSLVDRLPPVLMLHLKRFDFDYQTLHRCKLKKVVIVILAFAQIRPKTYRKWPGSERCQN